MAVMPPADAPIPAMLCSDLMDEDLRLGMAGLSFSMPFVTYPESGNRGSVGPTAQGPAQHRRIDRSREPPRAIYDQFADRFRKRPAVEVANGPHLEHGIHRERALRATE